MGRGDIIEKRKNYEPFDKVEWLINEVLNEVME
jgi:hypothetical protein